MGCFLLSELFDVFHNPGDVFAWQCVEVVVFLVRLAPALIRSVAVDFDEMLYRSGLASYPPASVVELLYGHILGMSVGKPPAAKKAKVYAACNPVDRATFAVCRRIASVALVASSSLAMSAHSIIVASS